MKKIGYFLIIIGLLVAGYFIIADMLGPDNYQGIGAAQLLGIQSGVFLLLFGIGLLIAEGNGIKYELKMNALFSKIIDLPIIFWIGLAFLTVFYFFFIKPMFLNSELQMNYFNRYIPNKSLIGLDIRTVTGAISRWLILGESPYTNGLLAYPPLALILLSPLLLIEFPANFILNVYLTLFSFLLISLIFPLAQNKSKSKSIIYILCALGIFSYGLQFELERGQFNLIAFAFCYASIFIFHAHPKLRYFSYILFFISIHLKIYTGICILLFINDWSNWKANARRLIGIVSVNFILLFILGINTFRDFLNSIYIHQFKWTQWNGSSIRGFVFRLNKTGYGLFSEDIMMVANNHPKIFEMFFLLLYGLCLVILIVYATSQNSHGFNPYLFVICTIGMLIIPSNSNDYKLPILVGPMAILLTRLTIQGDVIKKIISIILIFTMSAAFSSTLYPFEIKPEIMQNNMLVLFVILISITLYRVINSENNRLSSSHT